MQDMLTLVCAQFDPKLSSVSQNLAAMEALVERAVSQHHPQLILFPEAALTGYCFDSREELAAAALAPDSAPIAQLARLAARQEVTLVFGTALAMGDCLYNSTLMLEPDGSRFLYHKSHLPYLGMDRFVTPGPEVVGLFPSRFGRIGLLVCYELRFPEPARIAALQGARLLLQPTNLPLGGESHPDFLTRARACENRVPFASCNRVGTEGGFSFLGRSQILNLDGDILAEADSGEALIAATLDLRAGEDKDIIGTPGAREMYLFRDRRWQLYGPLSQAPDRMGFLPRG